MRYGQIVLLISMLVLVLVFVNVKAQILTTHEQLIYLPDELTAFPLIRPRVYVELDQVWMVVTVDTMVQGDVVGAYHALPPEFPGKIWYYYNHNHQTGVDQLAYLCAIGGPYLYETAAARLKEANEAHLTPPANLKKLCEHMWVNGGPHRGEI